MELADLYFLRKEIYDGEVAKIYAYNFAMFRDLDLIIYKQSQTTMILSITCHSWYQQAMRLSRK